MRLVLASANRDLLIAYGHWLESQEMAAETVFDAIQLQTVTAQGKPGLCILDEGLPMMAETDILRMLRDEQWQTLMLRKKAESTAATPALLYPFTPAALRSAVEGLLHCETERQDHAYE